MNSSKKPKVVLTYNDDTYLLRFKGSLIRELIASDHQVYAVCPLGPSVLKIQELGAIFVEWKLARSSSNLFEECKSIISLYKIYKHIKPDLVHHFTIKPNLYGSIAAKLAKVPVSFASINGLGFSFLEKSIKGAILRIFVLNLYRISFNLCNRVLFQNREDISFFVDHNIIPREKAHLIEGGSGVNISEYKPGVFNKTQMDDLRHSLQIRENTIIIILICRMLKHKGIYELIESIRILDDRNTTFLFVGPIDKGNPAAISLAELTLWEQQGLIKYCGERDDILELMSLAEIAILPSYREGYPRVLLEASSIGKPIVATNVPGCKDVVDHGSTGLLVPLNDPNKMAESIKSLIDSPGLRKQMGIAARNKAVTTFDERKVVKQILTIYMSYINPV